MNLAAGLALALLSAFALNWGWLEQHGATQEMPPLTLRRPVWSLRLLFADRTWLIGFVVGLAGWAFYVVALALAPHYAYSSGKQDRPLASAVRTPNSQRRR